MAVVLPLTVQEVRVAVAARGTPVQLEQQIRVAVAARVVL